MEMQEIEITIDGEGRVQVTARGIRGDGCLALTKNIESAVGTVEERTCTSEYYEQPVAVRDQRYLTR
jgi:hypothetical protein